MKKKIISLVMTLGFVLGLAVFSGNVSAAEGEYEEFFRIDDVFTFSPYGVWDIETENYSYEGGNYMVRLYDTKTKKVLFEKKDYIEARTAEDYGISKHVWRTPNKNTHVVDIVVYRENKNIEVYSGIRGRR